MGAMREFFLLTLLLAGCATTSEPLSEEDQRWLSSPFDTLPWGFLPRTGRPAASPPGE